MSSKQWDSILVSETVANHLSYGEVPVSITASLL